MRKELFLLILIPVALLAGCGRSSIEPASTSTAYSESETILIPRGKQSIQSATLGRELTFEIFLPPAYQDNGSTYPILYLIPGGGGTTSTWFELMGADTTAERLIENGEIPPLIMVSVASISDDQNGEALVNELVPYVDTHFHTRLGAQYRAVAGMSRGGFTAYRMAFGHPELFGSLGLFGSGVNDPEIEQVNDWLSATPAEQRPRVLMDYGDQDQLGRKAENLAAILDQWQVPYTMTVGSAGHDLVYWMSNLEMYLRWFAADW